MSDKIQGFRELTDAEISEINAIKSLGLMIQNEVDRLYQSSDTDKRWVAIGRTDLQTGLMALVRAVAKPNGF